MSRLANSAPSWRSTIITTCWLTRASTQWRWVLRVPDHYQITKDALEAGKHVFTEWPLGKDIDEAQELADLARSKGLKVVVGLQARAAPALNYLKELVEDGYIGEIMSCSMSLIRGRSACQAIGPDLAARRRPGRHHPHHRGRPLVGCSAVRAR